MEVDVRGAASGGDSRRGHRDHRDSKGGESRRKKLVNFQEGTSLSPTPDTDYEEQNNFKIEEIFRTPSHGCCPNQATSPTATSANNCKLTNIVTFQDLSLDLLQLQARVLELEHYVEEDPHLPNIISAVKVQLQQLQLKLDSVELREQLARRATHGGTNGSHCNAPGTHGTLGSTEYHRASDEHVRDVCLKFSQIWDEEVSSSIGESLLQPSFDTSGYDDAEMLVFLQHMFQQLGLLQAFQIPLPILRNFLCEVYSNYNQVPFHNFRHCFCVAQMMYVMAWHVDLVEKMGRLDTLILLVSCICHDLDHPGFNNIYQINARTELALRYNDISPLENHHCSVAFRILENPSSNIFITMDKETFKEVREGIIRCILATDMARHNEILTQFKEVTAEFEFSNRTHRNLLAMILIKVADISNEARPMDVAEPWLDRLLTEFFQQSDLEKLEGLPVTPFMDRDKITKPSSQCSFIGFVVVPLFEALGELLPSLQSLIIDPARAALEHYRKLNEAMKDERLRRKSVVDNGERDGEGDSSSMAKSSSGLSVGRRSVGNTSLQSRQRSKSSEEGSCDVTPPLSPGAVSISLEGEEEDEEELTQTEVEVAEKAVKFKISTEGATPGRNTCPNSRKGSRERCQLERECRQAHLNTHPSLEDTRRKSLAVIERHKDGDAGPRRRRSASRLMDAIDVMDAACWTPPPTPSKPPATPPQPSVTESDKPSLLAKLRALKDKLPWLDKEEDERCRTLPSRRKAGGGSASSTRRKSRGWRSWLAKGEGHTSSLDGLPHT